MDTSEYKHLRDLSQTAVELSQQIDKIENSITPGAPWSVLWSVGSSLERVELSTDQKGLIKKQMLKDLEERLKTIENDLIEYIT